MAVPGWIALVILLVGLYALFWVLRSIADTNRYRRLPRM